MAPEQIIMVTQGTNVLVQKNNSIDLQVVVKSVVRRTVVAVINDTDNFQTNSFFLRSKPRDHVLFMFVYFLNEKKIT